MCFLSSSGSCSKVWGVKGPERAKAAAGRPKEWQETAALQTYKGEKRLQETVLQERPCYRVLSSCFVHERIGSTSTVALGRGVHLKEDKKKFQSTIPHTLSTVYIKSVVCW